MKYTLLAATIAASLALTACSKPETTTQTADTQTEAPAAPALPAPEMDETAMLKALQSDRDGPADGRL